jgi:hypothetical protein
MFWIPEGGESGKKEYSSRIAGYGWNNAPTPVPLFRVSRVPHKTVDAVWGPDAINGTKMQMENTQVYGRVVRVNNSYQGSKGFVNLKGPMLIVDCDRASESKGLNFL